MTDIRVVVDCETGKVEEKPLTKTEQVQRARDLKTAQTVEHAEQAADADRVKRVEKVASSLKGIGLDIDDIREALR